MILKCGHPEADWNLRRSVYGTGVSKGKSRRTCRTCNAYKTAVHTAKRRGFCSPDKREWERAYLQAAQGEIKCAVPFGPHGGQLCIDHDHETGRVRGAVCFWHNTHVIPFLEAIAGDWATIQTWSHDYLKSTDHRFPGVLFKGPWVNIWGTPQIGPGTSIGALTEIGDSVVIGKDCAIGAMVFLPPGVVIGDNVFIGPRTVMTNDKHPRAHNTEYKQLTTVIENNVSIGAAAVILPGIRIKQGAVVGAGAVVTRDVEAGETVIGQPARLIHKFGKIYERE